MLTKDSKIWQLFGLRPTGDLGPWTFYFSQRNATVVFLRAPPLQPPSELQRHQRNKFRLVAYVWRDLGLAAQSNWAAAAERAHLSITGYNLFVWYQLTQNRNALATIERQSGINLIA
ncbi:MAG: hypothetical protein V3V75_06670 [Thermoguttaceae bacterium]